MALTRQLYLDDPYLTSVSTQVCLVRPSKRTTDVILDDNIFYPAGGGQPDDHGTLTIGDSIIEINKLRKERGDVILQIVGKPDIAEDSPVRAEIDWDRRYRFMRCHTAAHAVMAAISRFVTDYVPAGIAIAEDGRSVELCFEGEWSGAETDADRIIAMAVEEIDKDREVEVTEFPSLDEARSARPDIYRGPDDLRGHVRMVTIADWDSNPCGGLHVRRTREIGSVTLRSVDGNAIGIDIGFI